MNCFCTLRRLNSHYERLLSARSVHICQIAFRKYNNILAIFFWSHKFPWLQKVKVMLLVIHSFSRSKIHVKYYNCWIDKYYIVILFILVIYYMYIYISQHVVYLHFQLSLTIDLQLVQHQAWMWNWQSNSIVKRKT